jgi:hypothetical protein
MKKVKTAAASQLGTAGNVKNAESHTAPTKYGMGDYYGTGFKAPVGKMRSDSVGFRPVTKKQLGTPPKSVV